MTFARLFHPMFPSSLCRGVLLLGPVSHCFIDRRFWVLRGCTTPRKRRASTTGRLWRWFGVSMRRCRQSPGMKLSRLTTGVPELDKTPEAGGRFGSLAE